MPFHLSVFFLAALLFWTQAQAQPPRARDPNNEAIDCVDTVTQLGHLNFFTWSAKQILDFLARSEFLNEREWKTIELNPQLTLFIKDAADIGILVSEKLCPLNPKMPSQGNYGINDEVDALRHFVMSAYLAWKVGPDPARTFMAAHEDGLFKNSNIMDYYNNHLGFEFGRRFRETPLLERTRSNFLAQIRIEIQRKFLLPKAHKEDFLVINSGPTRCARKKYPNF